MSLRRLSCFHQSYCNAVILRRPARPPDPFRTAWRGLARPSDTVPHGLAPSGPVIRIRSARRDGGLERKDVLEVGPKAGAKCRA